MKRFVTLVLIAVGLIGCGDGLRDRELGPTSFDAATLREVEKEMGITLPADAKGLNYYYKAPMDPAFIAKIEIPAHAKDGLLKTLSALPHKPIRTSGGLPERIPWWKPTEGNVVLERLFLDSGGIRRRVLFTEKDAKWLLYLEWRAP